MTSKITLPFRIFTLEEGTDRLSRNVGNYTTRPVITQERAELFKCRHTGANKRHSDLEITPFLTRKESLLITLTSGVITLSTRVPLSPRRLSIQMANSHGPKDECYATTPNFLTSCIGNNTMGGDGTRGAEAPVQPITLKATYKR